MSKVNASLVIAGEGNFFEKAKKITAENGLLGKVIFLGYVKPAGLKILTPKAYAGITIFENTGLNQYHSLANRFFDYINGGIPQLCVNYPEYAALNNQHHIALLVEDISADALAGQLNKLLTDTELYQTLKNNCAAAAQVLNWENEEKKLLQFWDNILPLA